MGSRKRFTSGEATTIVNHKRLVEVNPLRKGSKKNESFTHACFRAAREGKIQKIRVNAGRYLFIPLTEA